MQLIDAHLFMFNLYKLYENLEMSTNGYNVEVFTEIENYFYGE